MDRAVKYAKNVAIISVAGLVVFFAIGAIMVVLESLTWEELGEWMSKALLVAAIFFGVNVIVGVLFSLASKSSDEVKK